MVPPYLKNQQSLPSLVGTPVRCSKFCTKSWKWLPQIKSFSLSTLGLNLSRIVIILCAVLQISQIYLTKRKRACVYPLCIALLQVWKWSGLYNFHSTKSLNNAASAQLVKHLPNYQFELDKSKLVLKRNWNYASISPSLEFKGLSLKASPSRIGFGDQIHHLRRVLVNSRFLYDDFQHQPTVEIT